MEILTLDMLTDEVGGKFTNGTRSDTENTLLNSTFRKFLNYCKKFGRVSSSRKVWSHTLGRSETVGHTEGMGTPMALQKLREARATEIYSKMSRFVENQYMRNVNEHKFVMNFLHHSQFLISAVSDSRVDTWNCKRWHHSRRSFTWTQWFWLIVEARNLLYQRRGVQRRPIRLSMSDQVTFAIPGWVLECRLWFSFGTSLQSECHWRRAGNSSNLTCCGTKSLTYTEWRSLT